MTTTPQTETHDARGVATVDECRREVADWPLLPDDEWRRVWSLLNDTATSP